MPFSDVQRVVVGRWNLVVRTPDGDQPAWLEVRTSGHRMLVGQFVGWHGSARPISRVDVDDDGRIRFAIPPQWEPGTGDLVVEGRLDGDRLAGALTTPDWSRFSWSGVRAPSLRRAAAPVWGTPIHLFNGADLAGWRVIQGDATWEVVEGMLRTTRTGGNLVTDQQFSDFQLHLEVRYPPGGNSGIYLRGRYEVQVLDGPVQEPNPHLQGAIYGFLTPSQIVTSGPGEWHSFDITLVGRLVTVVVNGTTVIAEQLIPGITGADITAALEAGPLRPVAVQQFSLDEIAAVHEAMESGHTLDEIAAVHEAMESGHTAGKLLVTLDVGA